MVCSPVQTPTHIHAYHKLRHTLTLIHIQVWPRTPPGLTQTHPGVSGLERNPDSLQADAGTLVLTRTQMHTSVSVSPQHTLPHTHLHVHTHLTYTHVRAHTPTCTQRSASAHRKRAQTHSFPTRAHPPPPIRAQLYAHTPLPPELQEPRATYWVPSCEAGRSVLPRAPNGICVHGSPQPRKRARGRGCGVPFPKLGAGARSAAAPGGAWARGAAPPTRSACARTSSALRPPTPARAPGAGGGS